MFYIGKRVVLEIYTKALQNALIWVNKNNCLQKYMSTDFTFLDFVCNLLLAEHINRHVLLHTVHP